MANKSTGSSISKAKLEELRKRAENKRAGSSATYSATATGSSVSPAKLAELKKKAAATKKPQSKESVPSIIAEMRSKSGQGKSTVGKKVTPKKTDTKAQKVPSIIAEMRSKKNKTGTATTTKSTGSSVSPTKLAELKTKAKANASKPSTQSTPSIIAEMRSKRPSMTAKKVETTSPKKTTVSSSSSSSSAAKNYNVGVSKGGVSFKEAFAHFRKKGNKTFTWNGKKYTTELAKSGKKSKPKGMAV